MIIDAMLRREEIHPLDYIFASMNCNIELLNEICKEARIIIKYRYRSPGAQNLRVEGILKVEKFG